MSVKPKIQVMTLETLKNLRVAEPERKRDGAEANIAAEDQLLKPSRLAVANVADVSDF